MGVIPFAEVLLQVLADGPRTEDQDVVGFRQEAGNLIDEPSQMLETMRFSGALPRTASTVSQLGIVSDMSSRATMHRHLGCHSG